MPFLLGTCKANCNWDYLVATFEIGFAGLEVPQNPKPQGSRVDEAWTWDGVMVGWELDGLASGNFIQLRKINMFFIGESSLISSINMDILFISMFHSYVK